MGVRGRNDDQDASSGHDHAPVRGRKVASASNRALSAVEGVTRCVTMGG